MPPHLAWHTRRDGDPGHRFLRQQLAEATRRLLGLHAPAAAQA